MKPAYVYDIETENWTTFVVGALYDGQTLEVYDWKHEHDFVSRLLGLRGEVYAHNGGRFDHLWLLDAAYQYGLHKPARVVCNSTGIISLDFGDGLRFLDSYRIFPMSLRTLTNGQKDNLSELCQCGNACGGYCAITRRMPPRVRSKVIAYLEQDCRGLWNALSHFSAFADNAGIEIGLTVGSTAWKSVKKELQLDREPFSSISDWKWCREGYYGGRAELFKRLSAKGYQYDVNSMYPAKIAQTPLPMVYLGREYGSQASASFRAGRPGVYRARVRVPESYMPPLPIRIEKPWRRMVYPYGPIRGVWTGIELEYAESIGCQIEQIQSGIVFAKGELIFGSWVDRLFNLRHQCGKKSREGIWLKFVMNSLTGKFGARIDQKTIILDPEDIRICRCRESPCQCGSYKPIAQSQRVFEATHERLQPCAHVEWSAYLTSAARIELHRQSVIGGHNDIVYCDTDGIKCERPRSKNIGECVGTWSNDGPYIDFIALAPKVYCYQEPEKAKRAVRAKGIPNPDWGKVIRGEPIEYQSIAGLRAAVNGKFFVRQVHTRTVSPNTGSRLPEGEIDTRPPHVSELDLLTVRSKPSSKRKA